MSANDELMMQFVEMTGTDPDTALYFLEMSNFDLESALNLMFSGDIPPPPQPSSSNAGNNKTDSEPSPKLDDQYDNQDLDPVRVADPVKQQVLLDYSAQNQSQRLAMHTNVAFSRAEDPSVEWMFPPPHHLSFPGTLAEARSTAMKDQKWILVNIQCDKEFSSHLLNRDVWTNETLVSLIRMNFIFWQRGTTSQDGQMFSSMHRLTAEMGGEGFPMIGIVDSRTGALIVEIKVTNNTDANDLILKLMEFLEANNISDSKAPTVRPRTASKSSSQPTLTVDDDDDDDDEVEYDDDDNDDDDEDEDEEEILRLAAALIASKASVDMPPPPQLQDSIATITSDDRGGEEEEEPTKEEEVPSYTASSSQSSYEKLSVADTAAPTEGGVKVSLKLAPELVKAIASATNGKPQPSLVRSFHGEEQSVQHIYAAVFFLLQSHADTLDPEYRNRTFDLLTAFPRLSLHGKRDLSVTGAGLKGAQVIMQWL